MGVRNVVTTIEMELVLLNRLTRLSEVSQDENIHNFTVVLKSVSIGKELNVISWRQESDA